MSGSSAKHIPLPQPTTTIRVRSTPVQEWRLLQTLISARQNCIHSRDADAHLISNFVLLNPRIQIATMEMNTAPNAHDRQVSLKDQMLNGLLTAAEVRCRVFDVQERWLNRRLERQFGLDPGDDLIGYCIHQYVNGSRHVRFSWLELRGNFAQIPTPAFPADHVVGADKPQYRKSR